MRYFSRRNKPILFVPRDRDTSFILCVMTTTVKMLFVVVMIIALAGAGIVTGVAKAWIDTVPDLDISGMQTQSQTSFVYDRYGNLITEYKGSENRIYVTIDQIPLNLQHAVVAIEDARFYTHRGVDIKRIGGAFLNNILSSGRLQGASTITCQLIKLTVLNSEQTYKRKLQEAYLALELEEMFTKDEIMENYLNVIYLGGASYGVKIAAQDYFGKDLSELTIRECAMLASIIRNPSSYNPRKNYYPKSDKFYPEKIDNRTDYVLGLMYSQGYITWQEYQVALAEKVNVLETSTAAADAMYDNAYYVEYAIYDVITKMLRVENLEDTTANRRAMENKLRNGGYKIYTSLDPSIQSAVQAAITNWDNYPNMRYEIDSVTQSSIGGGEYISIEQPQTACVIIDWSTGEIVAVVGGRDEPTQKKQFNRAYQSHMPVGSAIKPISVYAPAFDMGASPGTPVLNIPITIKGWKSDLGYPQNFSSTSYNGVESMREAIIYSHNNASAHTLMEYVTIENSVIYLLQQGVSDSSILATGAGLSLGSSGLSMMELCGAYSTIANMGQYCEPYAFTQVVNPDGTVYIDAANVQVKRQVYKQSTAWLINDCLEDCVENGTGTKAKWSNSAVVAGKTGTNTNNIGVTFAGYTAHYACALWIGSDYYKPLTTDATGGAYAAPLWAEVMKTVYAVSGKDASTQIMPRSADSVGIVKAECCGVSGMLATENCYGDLAHPVITDYYYSGTEPTQYCVMHRQNGELYVPQGHPLLDYEGEEQGQTVLEYFPNAVKDEQVEAP